MINKVIYVILLSVISYADIKKRVIPNWCCVGIIVNSLFILEKSTMLTNMVSAIVVGLVIILIKVLSRKTLGNGDIKLISACTFMLGLERMLWGLLVGMGSTLIWSVIVSKLNTERIIPLGPFISIGMIVVII